jgi:hypothetical protein
MILKQSLAILGGSLLATAAIAGQAPLPAPAGLTIEPSVTCPPGHRAEFIRLSRAKGDPLDSVFAFCRDPSKRSEE